MLFTLFDNFHKHRLGWFGAFFWDFLVLFLVLILLLLIFLVSGIRNHNIKILERYIQRKVAFLLAIRASQGVLGFLVMSKVVFYLCYYQYLTAEEYQDIFMSLPTNLLWFRIDYGTQIILFVLLIMGLAFLQYSYFFFSTRSRFFSYAFEFLILALLLMLGLIGVIISNDLLLLVLSLELVSFCIIVFVVMDYQGVGRGVSSIEAGIKYFIINAISVIFLLVAMGGFYGILGTLNLVKIHYVLFLVPSIQVISGTSLFFILIFFTLGFLMKVGAGPFQVWVVDVYEGTDFYVTSLFLGLIGPTFFAKFLMLIKTFTVLNESDWLFVLIYSSGILSIVFGSIGALMQMQVKRFLAYSSLTHVGFMLVALSCNTLLGYCAAWGYLFGYLLMTHGFLFVFFFIRMKYSHLLFTSLSHLGFLRFGGTLLVVFLVGIFFSFAGIPPLGGFFSKFVVFCALFEIDAFLTIFFLIIFVLIDAYIYLRVIRVLVFDENGFMQRFRKIVPDDGSREFSASVVSASSPFAFVQSIREYSVGLVMVVGGISIFLGGFVFLAPWFCPKLVDFVLLIILFS